MMNKLRTLQSCLNILSAQAVFCPIAGFSYLYVVSSVFFNCSSAISFDGREDCYQISGRFKCVSWSPALLIFRVL